MTQALDVVFRCDGRAASGLGHVMRCAALAQAFEARGHRCRFGFPAGEETGREAAAQQNLATVGEVQLSERADLPGRLLVLDHYGLPDAWAAPFQERGGTLLRIDDLGTGGDAADIVLNHNVAAEEWRTRYGSGLLLLGPRYALVRRAFVERARAAPRERVAQLLLSFGGVDSKGLVVRVLQALLPGVRGLRLHAVVGSACPHLDRVRALAAGAHASEVVIVERRTDLSELMASADLAITSGGTLCYELATVGVPMLIITTVDNQRLLGPALADRGGARWLGDEADATPRRILEACLQLIEEPEARTQLAAAARQVVDGQGPGRVVRAVEQHLRGAR